MPDEGDNRMGGDFHFHYDRADAADKEVVGKGTCGRDDQRETGGRQRGLDVEQ